MKIPNEQKNKLKSNRIEKKNRGSKYRGVFRNGKTWQILIMINGARKYIGKFKSEIEAAHAYDNLAIQFHKDKARLNFYHEGFKLFVNDP